MRTNHINMMTTGIEERQFLHTTDCAKALAAVMHHYDAIKQKETSVDITSFQWTTIRNLAYVSIIIENVSCDLSNISCMKYVGTSSPEKSG